MMRAYEKLAEFDGGGEARGGGERRDALGIYVLKYYFAEDVDYVKHCRLHNYL
jgi:hypothetical protein